MMQAVEVWVNRILAPTNLHFHSQLLVLFYFQEIA